MLSKEVLQYEYHVLSLNPIDISKKFNINVNTIIKLLKKFDVFDKKLYLGKNGREYYHIDISNRKFNRLFVLDYCHSGKSVASWNCICDCKNNYVVNTYSLLNGATSSCGCLNNEKRRSRTWTGYGEISGSYWSSLIKGASDRNINFDINIEYLWDLFLEQNRKCKLSGIYLTFSTRTRTHKINQTASLDRIDSNFGYIQGNVQWIHKDVNTMKWNLDQNYFIEMCKKIVTNIEVDNNA